MIYLPTLLPLVLETLSILKSSLRLLAMPGTTGGENKWMMERGDAILTLVQS